MTTRSSTNVPQHPCRFSPEVIEALSGLMGEGERVHDPFAGTGTRLGALCDEVGAPFSGADIEEWPGHDPRVVVADALHSSSYPPGPFTIVTSPVYFNTRFGDYAATGPLPTTKTKGRRDYAISLGRPLAPTNMARYTGKKSAEGAYWSTHKVVVRHWSERSPRVLLNVDEPISRPWSELLESVGYTIISIGEIHTRRYRGLANDEIRADHEVLIEARRP